MFREESYFSTSYNGTDFFTDVFPMSGSNQSLYYRCYEPKTGLD